MGQKSQYDAFSFSDLSRKNRCSHTHTLSKNVVSLKLHSLSSTYLLKKRQSFQKHGDLMLLFSIFSCKTPCCHAHIRSKNVNSVEPTKYYGTSQQDAFYFQKRPFSKKHTSPMPTLLSKNVLSLKNTVLSCNYSQILYEKSPVMKNPLLSCPYLLKKTSILSKIHL